jgi:hypothetical protein
MKMRPMMARYQKSVRNDGARRRHNTIQGGRRRSLVILYTTVNYVQEVKASSSSCQRFI